MGELLTLVRPDLPPPSVAPPPGYALRACSPDDIGVLGDLYFDSYDPGEASATREEAVADIRAAFAGEYGALWAEASPVAVDVRGDPVAAVQVVRRAPWPDTPDCPFVIELFTARGHRRRGLGRALIGAAPGVTRAPMALRVSTDNAPALALYRSLGFDPAT